ncbi:MAG: TPM domain-containing protein [Candidatus Electrothrix sp. AUS4]|nr:TPM domain-containing protein [Candidatus Electrothrix sp. AUS4]
MQNRLNFCNFIRIQHLLIVMSILGNLLFLPASSRSGEYPEADNLYVNDYAQLLTPEDATGIRTMFTTLRNDPGIEAVVLTISSFRKYETEDTTLEAFATNLFNTWGIGNKEKNNGVLILVAVNDRKMRIELGAGYPKSMDMKMKSVIDEFTLPQFKRNNYSHGIYQGVRAMIAQLTGRKPEDNRPLTAKMLSAVSALPSEARYGGGIVGGLLSLFGLCFGGRRYLRKRKRYCPKCRTMMTRLNEVADDAYLDAGQVKEESLQSVDYDVWLCPDCGTTKVISYNSWFSSYATCSKCKRRTMEVTSRTITSATTRSTGTGEKIENCANCGYHHTFSYTIPRRTESSSSGSSSSGSSSFGGGSSSGGGASGSW